ncbi:DNA glycosylase [Psychrobacillus sp. FSL H8-0510]|uniref:DNA glycosylase n=1 Tax=Psychrobacillus sp. FSL H8-0510 TaxID=2921394 RepID=UPI004046CE85
MVRISENTEGKLVIHFLEDNYVVSEKVTDEVHQYVREWLDLDNDLRPFYEMAKKDYLLHNAVDEFYGLRNIGIPDYLKQ